MSEIVILEADTLLYPVPKDKISKISETEYRVNAFFGGDSVSTFDYLPLNIPILYMVCVYYNGKQSEVYMHTFSMVNTSGSYFTFDIPDYVLNSEAYSVQFAYSDGTLGSTTKPIFLDGKSKYSYYYRYGYFDFRHADDYVFDFKKKKLTRSIIIEFKEIYDINTPIIGGNIIIGNSFIIGS